MPSGDLAAAMLPSPGGFAFLETDAWPRPSGPGEPGWAAGRVLLGGRSGRREWIADKHRGNKSNLQEGVAGFCGEVNKGQSSGACSLSVTVAVVCSLDAATGDEGPWSRNC